MHALFDLFAILSLSHGNIKLALQVESELRAVAEVAAQTQGRIGGDGASGIQNISDAT
jgi:hypothetical protein